MLALHQDEGRKLNVETNRRLKKIKLEINSCISLRLFHSLKLFGHRRPNICCIKLSNFASNNNTPLTIYGHVFNMGILFQSYEDMKKGNRNKSDIFIQNTHNLCFIIL